MTLENLEIGDKGKVLSINCENALKNRFYSFGIIKGAIVTIVERTFTKSTIEIKINSTRVALRIQEASKIEIEKC